MRLTALPKINWSLAVLGARPDGYHLLDSLMQEVELPGLYDTLLLEPTADGEIALTVESGDMAISPEKNLVWRAAKVLQGWAGTSLGARMHLRKGIPSGAGLGGGSADAAKTLQGLVALWQVPISAAQLDALALGLGADVPFFLRGGLARVGGIGEAIAPMPAMGTYKGYDSVHMVIVKPAGSLSTPAVFRRYDACTPHPQNPDMDMVERLLCEGTAKQLSRALGNALQPAAASILPAVDACTRTLLDAGAYAALMTGSGSAVFGLFEDANAACAASVKCAGQFGQSWCTAPNT